MTFNKYLEVVGQTHREKPEWRVGQAAFNVLMFNRPDLSEQIRATPLDPFNDKHLSMAFVDWVERNWTTEQQT